MKVVQMPIPFLKALADCASKYRSTWLEWIVVYGEKVKDPFFISEIGKTEGLSDEGIKECREVYQVGAPFLSLLEFSKLKKKPTKKELIHQERITDVAQKILDYLNLKTGSGFGKRNPAPYLKPIIAILDMDYTVQDCLDVIESKYQAWVGTEYEQYLQPSTLFKPEKFDNYLNQAHKTKNGTQTGSTKGTEPSGSYLQSVSNSVAKAHEIIDKREGGNPPASTDR